MERILCSSWRLAPGLQVARQRRGGLCRDPEQLILEIYGNLYTISTLDEKI